MQKKKNRTIRKSEKYSPEQIPKNPKKYPKYLNTRKDSRFYSKSEPINQKYPKFYTNI